VTDLVTLTNENKAALRDRALVEILQGKVIVVAAEHGYIYLCDAFNRGAVDRIHILRADNPGTAAQVLVGDISAVSGIAKDFDSDLQTLTKVFWPGLLTIQLAPQPSLNWDLGDDRSLGEFALRVPNTDFLLAILRKSGPLAAASASPSGHAPTRELRESPILQSEIGLIVDEGTLPEGPASTVLRRQIIGQSGGLEVVRDGAISLDALQGVLPAISAANP
jgi:tRNA threonylcarbamoyl adenosine modification protein (Sua5/YciO/YrdC/YwlC family)